MSSRLRRRRAGGGLDETLDAVQLAGMVVILLGVVRVTTRARRV